MSGGNRHAEAIDRPRRCLDALCGRGGAVEGVPTGLTRIRMDSRPRRRPISGAHFGWGAGAPPEVPGGGTTFGSPALGAGFSIPGSTSFGWMTPFDRLSFLLKLWAGARGVTSPGPELGAWANAGAARNATPATNRQSRETIAVMAVKRVHGRSVPWAEADIPCCFDRFTPAQTIRSMNRALRNSCGTSIIVRRLGRAPAHDEERHRGKGATRAVHRENMFDHGNSPHPPHPSPVIAGCRFDA